MRRLRELQDAGRQACRRGLCRLYRRKSGVRDHLIQTLEMKIEEAILYVLAERNGGLRTEQIADIINRRKLHVRKDGRPVTSAQVYAVAMQYPDTFVKAEGRIMLMI